MVLDYHLAVRYVREKEQQPGQPSLGVYPACWPGNRLVKRERA
jgi:hypothetical protein